MSQEMVDVFEAFTADEAQRLQARLEAAGIKAVVDGASEAQLVRVAKADQGRAQPIVATFEEEADAAFEAELGDDDEDQEP